MSVYRVLVAHRGYRVNEVIETDTPVLAYVKKIEEVTHVQGTGYPASGTVADDLPQPRRGRKPKAAEVTGDVADRTVSDSGLSDSES